MAPTKSSLIALAALLLLPVASAYHTQWDTDETCYGHVYNSGEYLEFCEFNSSTADSYGEHYEQCFYFKSAGMVLRATVVCEESHEWHFSGDYNYCIVISYARDCTIASGKMIPDYFVEGLSLPQQADLIPASLDADGDDLPDAVEGQLCGRQAVRDILNSPDLPGSCWNSSNYELGSVDLAPAYQTVNDLQREVEGIAGNAAETALDLYEEAIDNDLDFVPDAIEPTLCGLEDQNDPTDGTCTGDDYRLP